MFLFVGEVTEDRDEELLGHAPDATRHFNRH